MLSHHHCIGSDSPSPLVTQAGPSTPLLPDLHFPWTPTLPIGLACWEATTSSGQAEVLARRFSQPSVWGLTLSAPGFNAHTESNDCFYHLNPSKIVHCITSQIWLERTTSQILVLFYLLSLPWIYNSDIWNSPSAAGRFFAFTISKQWSFKWIAQNPSTPVVLATCTHKEGYDSEFPIFISWLVTQGKKAFQYLWWQKLYKYLFKLQVFPLKSRGSQGVF